MTESDAEDEMKTSDKTQQLDADECSLEKLGKLVTDFSNSLTDNLGFLLLQ